MMASAWGLIIASGKPEGFAEGVDPSFLTLGSKPVMMHALAAFEKCADIEGLVILASKDRVESVRAMVQMFGCAKVKRILPLAGSRAASILGVVKELQGDKVPVVTIHEGIRPMVAAEEIAETVKLAKKHGAAVLCDRLPDPVRVTEKGSKITANVDGAHLWACRSPQSFKVDLLVKALEAAAKKKAPLRDEADAVALVKGEVHVVPSTHSIIRINGPRDLVLADYLLRH